MSKSSKLVNLYKPKSEVEFSIISSLLEEAKIPFMVRNSEVQDLFGVGRIGTGYNFVTGPMIILVNENHLSKAREIISEFLGNFESQTESDAEFDLYSTYNMYLNMSIVLGIVFPGFGIYHLIKAIGLAENNKDLHKQNLKISISFLIFLIGCFLWILILLD